MPNKDKRNQENCPEDWIQNIIEKMCNLKQYMGRITPRQSKSSRL